MVLTAASRGASPPMFDTNYEKVNQVLFGASSVRVLKHFCNFAISSGRKFYPSTRLVPITATLLDRRSVRPNLDNDLLSARSQPATTHTHACTANQNSKKRSGAAPPSSTVTSK